MVGSADNGGCENYCVAGKNMHMAHIFLNALKLDKFSLKY
jgi:hypothetical protein